MITGAQLIPYRDQLSALIAAAQVLPVVGGTPSAAAMAEGFGVVDFYDDFDDPASLDSERCIVARPGNFKWFLGWPTQGGDFSIADSVLTITQDRSGDGGNTLTSVPYGWPDAGRSFLGSRWYEVRARWDAQVDRWPNAGAVFWSFSLAHMRWQLENNRTGRPIPNLHICELDFFESPRSNGQQRIMMSIADWYYSARPGFNTQEDFVGSFLAIDNPGQAFADTYLQYLSPNFDCREWHTYATAHKTAADNGGTGYVHRYVDGIHIPQLDVTWKPGGLYSVLDDDARYLILGDGLTTHAQYDHVMVCRS